MPGHFAIKLPGAPAGIAQRRQPARRAPATGDVLQHIERGGKPPDWTGGICHRNRALALVIGTVQHETAPGFDRSAVHHQHIVCGDTRVDVELLHERAHCQPGSGIVDHQPKGAVLVVQAHGDDAAFKTRITDAGHGEQQSAGQEMRNVHLVADIVLRWTHTKGAAIGRSISRHKGQHDDHQGW